MRPSPTYCPPEGEECETSVEHGLPLRAEPAVGYCSRRPRPSPMWRSRFVAACAVGRCWVSKSPLVRPPLRGKPSPEMTYLPYLCCGVSVIRCPVPVLARRPWVWRCCALSHPLVVCCAEGAVTKGQRPGCLPTGKGKRAGLCVLCARCV